MTHVWSYILGWLRKGGIIFWCIGTCGGPMSGKPSKTLSIQFPTKVWILFKTPCLWWASKWRCICLAIPANVRSSSSSTSSSWLLLAFSMKLIIVFVKASHCRAAGVIRGFFVSCKCTPVLTAFTASFTEVEASCRSCGPSANSFATRLLGGVTILSPFPPSGPAPSCSSYSLSCPSSAASQFKTRL